MMQPSLNPQQHRELPCPFPQFLLPPSCYQTRDHDVFFGSEFRQQIMELKNKADFRISESRQFVAVQGGQVFSFHYQGTLIRLVQGTHYMKQRTFTGSRRSNNGYHLSGLYGNIHAFKDMQISVLFMNTSNC